MPEKRPDTPKPLQTLAKSYEVRASYLDKGGMPHRFVHEITTALHYIMVFVVWTVYWGGCLLSLYLVFRWFNYVFYAVVLNFNSSFEDLLHHLLESFELLVMIPMPAIMGRVVYHNLMAFTYPFDTEKAKEIHAVTEDDLGLMKGLILGILVTVTGTKMLDKFMLGEEDIMTFVAGGVIILSVTAYSFFGLSHKK